MKNLELKIQENLASKFAPHFLKVDNISHMHNVPHGAETHFAIYLVSDKFNGKKTLERQRLVHEVLKPLQKEIHSTTQKLQTLEEWQKLGRPTAFDLPECFGGSKK